MKGNSAVNAVVPCAADYEQTMLLLYYAFLLRGVPKTLNISKEAVPELGKLGNLSPDLSKEQINSLISRAQDTLGDHFPRKCAEQESLVSYYHEGAKKDPLIIWVDGLTSPGTWPLWTLFNVKRQVDACFDGQLRGGRYDVDLGLLVMKYPFHKEGQDPRILGGSSAKDRLKQVLDEITPYLNNQPDQGSLKRPIILVGHSAGAQMVLEVAKELKDQVKLVVPINVPYTFRHGVIHFALAVAGTMVGLFPNTQRIFNEFSRYFGPSKYLGEELFNIVPESHWRTRVFNYLSFGLFASLTATRLNIIKILKGFVAPVYFINSDRDELFTFLGLEKTIKNRLHCQARFSFKELISPHTPTTHYTESEALASILAQAVVDSVEKLKEPEARWIWRCRAFIGKVIRRIFR